MIASLAPNTDHFDIVVIARNGVVTFGGNVDSKFERERAARAASRLRGTVAIRNRLRVVGANQPKPDWAIREDIETQLKANPFAEAERITIAVDWGVATFRGAVRSAIAFRQAEKSAYRGGALLVHNRLTIHTGNGKR